MRKIDCFKKILAAALLCGALLAAPAGALEILYPADGTYVERSYYLIIKGGTTPELDGVTVSINGIVSDLIDIGAAEYRAAFGDMVILQPEWEKGKNRLEVTGYAGGKPALTSKAEFFYLGGNSGVVPPKGFKPFVMHVPEREKVCQPCHNMNPDKGQLAANSAETNPCGSCHRRMLERKYVHGPAGVYECVACHDPASRPARYQLLAKAAALCNECHFDKVDQYRKSAFVHGPVGVGQCTLCHDPHASDQPAQLYSPVNSVCSGCHDTIKAGEHVVRGLAGQGHPLEGKKNPLKVGAAFHCASCHDPHAGMVGSLFVMGIKGRFELCQQCHKK